MKKRLISLLVALCMAVTLLPVSAITAWAEEGGSTLKPLQIQSGYPVLDDITPTTNSDGHEIYTGDGWSYDATAKVLTIAPESPTTYDLKDYGSIRKDYNSIACSTIIEKNATIVMVVFGHQESWFQYYQSWHYNEWHLLNARYKSWYYYRRHFS